ncbi:MAG: tail fiber domain-containing protein, partial [Bacteroidales bacterium]|nr:tail fiber domain-containing protein [Bacteroidales bacterium]
GKVLTSDANGNAWWQDIPDGSLFVDYGDYLSPKGTISDNLRIADKQNYIYGFLADMNTGTNSGYGAYFRHTNSSGGTFGIYASSTSTTTNNYYYSKGAEIISTSNNQDQYGIQISSTHNGTGGFVNGIHNTVISTTSNSSDMIGIYSSSSKYDDNGNNMGIDVTAFGGYNVYGIKATASGGSNFNTAGYFDGDVTITGTLYNPSDIKLKENIQTLANATEKIKQINAVAYQYKNDGYADKLNLPGGGQYGFIAQELEKVFPELVSEQIHLEKIWKEKNGEKTFEYSESTYKAINYIALIPILTQALKEQQELIEKLQNEVNGLKNK